jgi:hypothetical protein
LETPTGAAHWPDQARGQDTQGPHGRHANGPEWRLLDPMLGPADTMPDAAADPAKHSDYWLDPCWPAALATVR